jgi:HEAT repeat protein
MSETDLQLGGGYRYQWECAILLALNYFLESPSPYDKTLHELITQFLGRLEELQLEGVEKDRQLGLAEADLTRDRELEDINLSSASTAAGRRRVLIQVKTKEAEGELWKLSDPLFIKALGKFVLRQQDDPLREDTAFVFLTNRDFNPDIQALLREIEAGELAQHTPQGKLSKAGSLHRSLENHLRSEGKAEALDYGLFKQTLLHTRLVYYQKVDFVESAIKDRLEVNGWLDWQQAYARLFVDFVKKSTHKGGGVVTRQSLLQVLGSPLLPQWGRIQAGLQPALGGGPLDLEMAALTAGEAGLLSNKQFHLLEQLQYLDQLEKWIEQEMSRSADPHFVALSLAQAHPPAPPLASASFAWRSPPEGSRAAHAAQANLADLDKQVIRSGSLVLLGMPGSGKSTQLYHLALRLIGTFRTTPSALLPVFIPLKEYSAPPEAASLQEFMRKSLLRMLPQDHFILKHFNDLARLGRFVFILDGLDQMPERTSEKARMEQLQQLDLQWHRLDRLIALFRGLRLGWVVSRLVEEQRELARQNAPVIDPRERQIEELARQARPGSAVIVSCRLHDFFGVPAWQQVLLLPMNESQVHAFLAPLEAPIRQAILQQWQFAGPAQSLISNPFYLRLLTRFFTSPGQAMNAEIQEALQRRGKLLEVLIRRGIEQHHQDAAGLLKQLGRLAQYMLERNIIDAVPQEALSRSLGEEASQALEAAETLGLLEIRKGPPLKIEFSHQIFLETMLAFHFLQQSQANEGQAFNQSLELLARQGDRWAETLRLLFEMVDRSQQRRLVDQFIEALSHKETWDIATRILAEVGENYPMAEKIVPLLQKGEDELARRGAAIILGAAGARVYADRLADLHKDPSWMVQRAAVEALAELQVLDRLPVFENASHPSVLRAVLRAHLALEQDPLKYIREILASDLAFKEEQLAWAVFDASADLARRIPEADLRELLLALMNDNNPIVRLVSYLACGQMPDSLLKSLKERLWAGALEEEDPSINQVARRLVSPFIRPDELEELKRTFSGGAPAVAAAAAGRPDPLKRMRAYLLWVEGQAASGAPVQSESLASAQAWEVQKLISRLVERQDASAMAGLTHLLTLPNTRDLAMNAFNELGPKGMAYLLLALQDPDERVRITLANTLKYYRLPSPYGRQVRKILREQRQHTHPVRSMVLMYSEDQTEVMSGMTGTLIEAAMAVVMAPLSALSQWLNARIARIATPYAYWLGYDLFATPPALLTDPDDLPTFIYLTWDISALACLAPVENLLERDYWLTRGRLLRAENRVDTAILALDQALGLDPASAAIRCELALAERSRGRLEAARFFIEPWGSPEEEASSQVQGLRELLNLEEGRLELDYLDYSQRRARCLVRLGLWDQALPAMLELAWMQADLPGDFFLLLYQCYLGLGRSRSALAAALRHNAQAESRYLIPVEEIERLRWLHHPDPAAAETAGGQEMAADLHSPQVAEAARQARQNYLASREKAHG